MSKIDQRFSLKHALSLLAAIGITLLIIIFRHQLLALKHLAYAGAFLSMLIGNATIIFPVPGLIVVYALGSSLNPLLLGLVAGPGAALGELTGYLAGFGGSAIIDNYTLYHKLKRFIDRHGVIVIAILAAIPNPAFDLAGMIAGSARIPWWKFLLAALIGKTIQALFVAYAGALSWHWLEPLISH